jgi:hypothetical protein
VEPTTAEQVFCFLLGGGGNLNWPPLWGREYALLRVVAAWALLGPMYVKEFGPHIVRAFPDVARAMQPAITLATEPLIPLEELFSRVCCIAEEAQAAEIAFHKEYGADAREDGIARFVKDHVCSVVGGDNVKH